MANIDRADWHYGGDYPAGLPTENGGTHIGMYLAWIIQNDLASKKLLKLAGQSLQLLRDRKITGRVLLFCELDEKFFPTLLTKTGKDFTQDYYETQSYFMDYETALAGELPTLYHVADTWDNYDQIAAVVDQRFAVWQKGEKPPAHPQYVAQKAAEEKFYTTMHDAMKAPMDPAAAVAILEAYLASDPAEPYLGMADREVKIIRANYGVER